MLRMIFELELREAFRLIWCEERFEELQETRSFSFRSFAFLEFFDRG
jgi:hypothetical protein